MGFDKFFKIFGKDAKDNLDYGLHNLPEDKVRDINNIISNNTAHSTFGAYDGNSFERHNFAGSRLWRKR